MQPELSAAEEQGTIDPKNLHALTFELPAATARHLNGLAGRAGQLTAGEHMHFPEKDQRYIMLAVPAGPLPKQRFLEEYGKLEVLINGEQHVRLADYPRLFSYDLEDESLIRGVPTIVPVENFPDGFIGAAHDFELLRDGKRIFGPVRWLVPDARTGPIVTEVKGGPGKGEVTINFEKVDFRLMSAVLFMDARFDPPLSVEQVLSDGSTAPLKFRMVGTDIVGGEHIFREAYVDGFTPGFARELAIRLRFDRSGPGYFAAVSQAYTTFTGNRVIDVP